MSVDIARLTEHLSPKQREGVRKAYQARAENETAAFLWCFFLGVVGAHHFYLRQWGKGLAHLWPPLATALVVAGGVVFGLSPVLIVLAAVPLVFFAVIWMFVDLFRIDAEVASRNLQLAEQLTAAALLADPAREQHAFDMLAAAEQRAPVAPAPPPASPASPASAPSLAPSAPEVVALTGVAGIAAAEGYHAVETAGAASQAAQVEREAAPASTDAGWSVEAPSGTEQAHRPPAAASTFEVSMPGALGDAAEEQSALVDAATFVPPTVSAPQEPPPLASAPTPLATAPAFLLQAQGAGQAQDVTDLGLAAGPIPPVADIEPGGAWTVQLPEVEAPTAPAAPSFVGSEPVSAVDASEATLVLVPEPTPAPDVPVWPVAPEWPMAQEETATLAGGGGMDAANIVPPVAPAAGPAEAQGTLHGLRHIRVVRQVKIGDEVVEEAAAEAYIDPGEDPEPVRQRLREQLRREADERQARGEGGL